MKKLNQKLLAAFVVLTAMAGSAHAELPPDAQAAVDQIITFSDDIIAIAWGIVATILVATTGIKLIKKFTGKAT